MLTKTGLRRLLHFGKVSEEASKNHETFAAIVRELTGDWVNPMSCDKIQSPDRFYYDEVVYFGSLSELEEGGKVDGMNKASMIDRYQFDEGRVGFFHNEDEKCRKERNLQEDKSYIAWFNGENSVPYILEVEDGIDAHRIMFETNVRAVNGTPKWGSRANSAIFDFYKNGLIYMMEEMLTPE